MIVQSESDIFVDSLYNLVNRDFRSVKGKDVVLLMGGTGNGKSTFLNMMAGSQMTASKNKKGIWQLDANPAIALIGHQISETFVPNYWEEKQLRVYDCPGFNDTRDIEHEIVKSLFIKEIADNANSIKIIVVGDIYGVHSGRCKSFQDCFKQLKDFIPGFNITSDYSLIITKAESDFESHHIRESFIEYIQTEVSEKMITVVYRPSKDGVYDYSYLDFNSIVSSTPTISSKCNVPLSAQAKLRLLELSRELNKSVERAVKAFSHAVRLYYLEVLAYSLEAPNSEFQHIASLFGQIEAFIKQSESPNQFVKNIKRYSLKLQHECRINFEFAPLYEFIDKKLKQIAFLKDKIDSFEVRIEDWIQCVSFDCEPFEKSINEAELKNIDSFTSFLKDTLNMDISKDIKPQAHAYLLISKDIEAKYSGSQQIVGAIQHKGSVFKTFTIPYIQDVTFSDHNLSYNGSVQFKGKKHYYGFTNVEMCSISRCRRCDPYPSTIPKVYSGYIDFYHVQKYNGHISYQKKQKFSEIATFSREAAFSVRKQYNETVNFAGIHNACCVDHHRCSCEQLAKIALSAKELFDDIQCFRRIAAVQKKEMVRLGKQCEGEDGNNEELAIAKDFNFEGFKVTDRGATLRDITNRIHDTLSQTHTFSAPYSGSVNHKIEKSYCQSVRLFGQQTFEKEYSHKADVPYQGIAKYNEKKSYYDGIECLKCYCKDDFNCYFCYAQSSGYQSTRDYHNASQRAVNRGLGKYDSYYKPVFGFEDISQSQGYQGVIPFSQTKKLTVKVPYDEVVQDAGILTKDEQVVYSRVHEVACEKDSVGDGHHNCTSCQTWERFVDGLKVLLEIKAGKIAEIQQNKFSIEGLIARRMDAYGE